MKKEYVSLSLKIVDVQLSDCIAGSITNNVEIEKGDTDFSEMNNVNYEGW